MLPVQLLAHESIGVSADGERRNHAAQRRQNKPDGDMAKGFAPADPAVLRPDREPKDFKRVPGLRHKKRSHLIKQGWRTTKLFVAMANVDVPLYR
jgi:hypothetical protein